jgi:hypothetical protein
VLFACALALAGCRRDSGACAGGARLALAAPRGPVGFDADISVAVRVLCPEAREGTITWRQTSGPRLGALAPSERGFGVRVRTPALAASLGGALPWGVVPLSPRATEIGLEATWTDGRGHQERHEVHVAAAPRSRGLPNVALGTRTYLGGSGWRLEARPPGSSASLETAGGATSLLPDVAGDWRLADGGGRQLTLRSARYDETPLDCGRSGCHGALVTAAAGTKMTTVLARGLSPSPAAAGGGTPDGHGALFGPGYPDCALACHATGEPGVADGGFTHVMGELGLATLGPRRWEAVPRALRRLGGVGCLACHGPGALPEASARWSILRADVCATCHDAAPRYGHVAAWRSTAMARADRDARAAAQPACARCHTTWGFLASLGAAEAGAVDRRPPPGVGPVGIGCAACHSVHDHSRGRAAPSELPLLRPAPRPALLADVKLPPGAARSGVCLGCHTPGRDETAPAASAAALWLGRGGLDPRTGAALDGAAPHAAVAGGCVGCHRAGPSGVERGAGHAFATERAGCASCHPRGLPADDLPARARGLWEAWRVAAGGRAPPAEAGAGAPPHAGEARLDRATPLGRAGWNIALVLEDPAAAAHNAPYARMLLAAAERTLNGAGTPPGRP